MTEPQPNSRRLEIEAMSRRKKMFDGASVLVQRLIFEDLNNKLFLGSPLVNKKTRDLNWRKAAEKFENSDGNLAEIIARLGLTLEASYLISDKDPFLIESFWSLLRGNFSESAEEILTRIITVVAVASEFQMGDWTILTSEAHAVVSKLTFNVGDDINLIIYGVNRGELSHVVRWVLEGQLPLPTRELLEQIIHTFAPPQKAKVRP